MFKKSIFYKKKFSSGRIILMYDKESICSQKNNLTQTEVKSKNVNTLTL